MKTWDYEINDVLIIKPKGVEQVARLAGTWLEMKRRTGQK